MKLFIAALISAAIFLAVPNQGTPVNNSVAKVAHTKQAEPTTPKQSEPKAEVVSQVAEPVAQEPAPQPEPTLAPVVAPEPLSDKEQLMSQAGIPQAEWAATDYIVSHESSWNPSAVNASSGATGLCQALPASKMASAGGDYLTNPVTQLKWCHEYANSRYGNWWASFAFWQTNRWW